MAAGRPADPDRRARVLQAATDHVAQHGLDGLSLRPLSAALSTSPRMLLYDFGSKESLVSAIMDEVRSRQAAVINEVYHGRSSSRASVTALWRWLLQPEHAGYVRLYAQVRLREASASRAGRERSPDPVLTRLQDTTGSTYADVLVISTLLHGLALSRLGAADPAPIDAAFEHFLGVIRN